ncbi:MAG: phosphoribosyltransferase family protein [Dehalococcoidia bacterium]
MSVTDELRELKAAIERHCITVHPEPVALNSGGFSHYYCDLKGVALHPRYARTIGRLMAPEVIASGAEAVGGLAAGCIPIADAVAHAALDLGRVLPTFFGRAEAKTHGPQEKAMLRQAAAEDEGPLIRPGRRVAIVEDAVTQGGAAMQAVEFALAEGCEVVLVMCVVERHEGGGARFRERGIPFRRLFYTLEDGSLHVDQELIARVGGAS